MEVCGSYGGGRRGGGGMSRGIPKQCLGIRPSITRLSTTRARNIPHRHNNTKYLPRHPISSVVNTIRKSSTYSP